MNENALTVTPPPEGGSEYPLLRPGGAKRMIRVFHDNMGSEGLSLQMLQRIKVPAGGVLQWQISTPEGDEMVKEVDGIILTWRTVRLYWKKDLNQSGAKIPPDCISNDNFIGIGDPGGRCNVCPFAQFGSSQKGGLGQACKQVRQMLIVLPGVTLPYLLSIPPTSIKPSQLYFQMLTGRGLSYWEVTTKLRLEKATSQGGIGYARVQFFQGRALTPAEVALVEPYHEQMEKMLTKVVVDARDYSTAPEVNLESKTTHGIFRKPPVDADPDPPFDSGPAPAPAERELTDDDIPF